MELFRMPRVALNDDEVMVLSSWIVAEGGSVSEGVPVVEVETAKANMEVEAPSSGVLALQLRAAGAEVSPGDVIGVIAEVGEIIDPATLEFDDPGAAETDVPVRIADESDDTNTDPNTVPDPNVDAGDADGGTPQPARASAIVPLENGSRDAPAALAVVGVPSVAAMHRRAPRATSGFLVGSTAKRTPTRAVSREVAAPRSFGLSRHRQALGRLMTASAAIPQFSVHTDIPSDDVMGLVTRLRAADVPATFTDVLLKAAAVALGRHPRFNSQFTGTDLIEFDQVSIGIAVDTDSGVLAPVIHDVDTLSWRDLALRRKDIVDRARAGRVPPANLSGGTFSISNVGPLGAQVLVPMLTPPQTGILGIAATHPTFTGNAFTAVIVADHRIHDGADAARFLASFSEALAHPDRLMLS